MFVFREEKTEPCIRTAEEIYQQLYRENRNNDYLAGLAAVENCWVQLYRHKDEYDLAEEHGKKRLEILRKIAEKDHSIRIRNRLATAYYDCVEKYCCGSKEEMSNAQ